MRLHKALKLPDPETCTNEVVHEVMAALMAGATEALAGGVRLSLRDWADQSPREEIALASAGRLLVAKFLRGDADAMEAEVDGGQKAAQASLSGLIDRALGAAHAGGVRVP